MLTANELVQNEQYQLVLLARILEALESLGIYSTDLFSVDVTQAEKFEECIAKNNYTINIVLPIMQQQQKGAILNLRSVVNRKSRPMFAAYGASKATVKSLMESLHEANAKYEIGFTN